MRKKKSLVGWISQHTKLYFRTAPLGEGKMIAIFLKQNQTISYDKKVRITIEEIK